MQTYFHVHSKLHPFRIFSLEHIVTMGIIFVFSILVFVFKNKLEEKGKYFRITLALLILVSDTSQQLWLLYEHAWSLKRALPLQLSDLTAILASVMLLTMSYRLFQFMYFAGLGSSILAILTPDLSRYSFPHFQYIEFFVSHGGVVLACLLMVAVLDFRPTISSMWATILIVSIYSGCIFFLNKFLGSKYLYIMKKPRNASLLDYLGPWPWYLISLELVMIFSFYILYSPFWIKRKL